MKHHYYPLEYKPEGSSKADDYLQYAEVYKDMIQFVLEKFSTEPPIHDYALAPVLLILRQYIELQLKGIIFYGKISVEVQKNHDIIFLYREAEKAIEEKYGTKKLGKPNQEVVRFIYALGNFDRKGEAFRYPETSKGESFCDKIKKIDSWLYERIASLSSLSEIANKVIGDLEGIEGYLDYMSSNEQEYYSNL
jgi:hypothetical protein